MPLAVCPRLAITPTGKKLLGEKEESERKLVAEAVEERKRLVQQLEAAKKAEDDDAELKKLIAEQKAFFEAAPKRKRTAIFAEGADVNISMGMLDRISARRRTHRDRVERLRKTLKETAPSWLKDMVTIFVADLAVIEQATRAATERIDEQSRYDMGGNPVLDKVKDYAEYREQMLGRPGGRGWLQVASKQARAMLLEAISPTEAQSRLEAIRKTEPKRKASWRDVR